MKKLRRFIVMLLISISLFGLCGCQGDNDGTKFNETDNKFTENVDLLGYEQIDSKKAKEIMDSGVDYILIDARTEEEFSEGHIEGAVLIPEYEIANRAEEELPDKDALILVYCRSGRRSKIASADLVKLGYTNVKEFGGIIDWPYDVVK